MEPAGHTSSMDVEALLAANRAAAAGGRRWLLVVAGVVGLVVIVGAAVGYVLFFPPGAAVVTVTTATTTTVTGTTTVTTTTTTTMPKPSTQNPIRGICYAPLPCTTKCVKGSGTPEDMTLPGYANMWDTSGRDDFGIMKAMGANTIREYHSMGEEISFSQPKDESDRTKFLAALKRSGLNLFGGIHQGLDCGVDTKDDCFPNWYQAVRLGLSHGFAVKNAWHESVWAMNMINEVDAMVGEDPMRYMKRLVSALDALLTAERDAGLTGEPIKLTSCFTAGIHTPFGGGAQSIFFGFASMENWFKNPHLVSYTPNASTGSLTELARQVEARWIHCINVQTPWPQIIGLIPKKTQDLPTVGMGKRPWIIGEMGFNGRKSLDITKDLQKMHTFARTGPTNFYGTLFFQFQTCYWKTGAELNFGMFGLAEPTPYSITIAKTPWHKEDKTVQLRCLTSNVYVFGPKFPGACGGKPQLCNHRAQAVAEAFGGKIPDGKGVCLNSSPMGPR